MIRVDAMRRIRGALSYRCELWSALAAIAWAKVGYWGALNLDAIGIYHGATRIFSGATWEALALGVGCFQLVSLLLFCRWARVVGALIAGWFWIVLGGSFFMSDGIIPGLALYFGIGLAQVHSTLAGIMQPR